MLSSESGEDVTRTQPCSAAECLTETYNNQSLYTNDSWAGDTLVCVVETSSEDFLNSTVFQVLVYVMYSAVFFVALVGNGLVCYVVYTAPRMKTVTNYFIVNLAVGDVLMTLFCVPFSFVSMLALRYWPFGTLMCKAVNYSQAVSVLVSAYTLLAISLDRYAAIMRPLKPRLSKVSAKLVVAAVWCGALATAAPIPVVSRLQRPSLWHKACEVDICLEQWERAEQSGQYTCALLALQFALPLCALVCTYARIAHAVWGTRAPGEAQSARDSRMQHSKRKMVKMMVMVVAVFTISWLPLNIFIVLWSAHEGNSDWNTWAGMPYVWFASHWLAMSHSCYNPIIYCYMNARYRRGFRQALCGLLCLKSADNGHFIPKSSEGIPLSGVRIFGIRTVSHCTDAHNVQVRLRSTRPAAPTVSSRKSSKKSDKARRLAKAREERLRILLEIADNKIATIEDETDSEEDGSVDTERSRGRVDAWLNKQTTEDEPRKPEQQKESPVPAPIAHPAQPAPLPQSTPLRGHYDAPPQPANPYAASMNTSRVLPPVTGDVPARAPHTFDLSDLAAAITSSLRTTQQLARGGDFPIFSGSHHEWLLFKTAYIESAAALSESERLARLRRCLRGNAKEAVERLLLYGSTSVNIMNALERRFGRADHIAQTELTGLQTLPAPKDTPRDICIFASRFGNGVAALRALDRSEFLHNPAVVRSTLDKLPAGLRYRWVEYAYENDRGLPDLLRIAKFLDREADRFAPFAEPEPVIDSAPQRNSRFNEKKTPAVQRFPRPNLQRTYAATATETTPCPICNSERHDVRSCAEFLGLTSDERWEKAKNLQLCYRCLRNRDRRHKCRRTECGENRCTRSHHKLLHFVREEKETPPQQETVATVQKQKPRAYLKMIAVRVSGPAGAIDTTALIDDGSTVTLIEEDLALEVGASGNPDPLHIEAIGPQRLDATQSRRVVLTLQTTGGQHEVAANTIESVFVSAQHVTAEDLRGCDHLEDIAPQLMVKAERPRMIIGQDNVQLLLPMDIRRGQPHQPVATRTPLGWVLHGTNTARPSSSPIVAHMADRRMDEELRDFFSLESVMIEPRRPKNDPEEQAKSALHERTTQQEDGHYEVPLLWKDPETWPPPTSNQVTPTGEERVNVCSSNSVQRLAHALPQPERFSKWERLIRTTARVLQFIECCRTRPNQVSVHYKRTKKNEETDPTWRATRPRLRTTNRTRDGIVRTPVIRVLPIDASLLRRAEELLVRSSQRTTFAEEINDLGNNKLPGKSSRLRRIAVELCNGTLKLKSRIEAATEITETQKRPSILDGNSTLAKLYIEYVHRQLHHAGVEATINEVQQRFWIIRLRTIARMVLHRCLQCRRLRATPPAPATGDHPRARLAHHRRPFTCVGVDYFGPITVAVGRTIQKRYVALFTCLTTRAVHLELAGSLTVDSAIMALRRMIARRGCPSEIWSDNGTNLRGADKELRLTIDAATEEEASKRTIQWRYIPPGAPFMGGAWERLVRSVKTALVTVMTTKTPTEEVLTTLLAEVEFTVNSRPLTHVSVDPEDPEAITPNHFLLLGPARVPIEGDFNDQDLIGRTHWRASQRLADLFWERWVREYLPTLQNRREPYSSGPPVEIGDVVLLVDNTQPRNSWPLGVVTAVYPGADGVVRTLDVYSGGTTRRRAAKKIVVLPTDPPTVAHRADSYFAGVPDPETSDEVRRENVRDSNWQP